MLMKVVRLNNFFGAEVQEIDLRDLSNKSIDDLQSLWLEYKVLVFRNQSLTSEEHINFSKHFGDLEIHPFGNKHVKYQEILVLESGGSTGKVHYSATDWHSDVTYREKPPMGSILRGVVVPKVGGDTCFADAVEAHNRLDLETKRAVSELTATHDWFKKNHQVLNKSDIDSTREKYPLVSHPVIRKHPETGEKAIFTNNFFTDHIDGVDENESNILLQRLENAIRDPSIQIRVRWDKATVVLWDNRCVQHTGTDDFLPAHRRMERTTILGDRPF